MKRYAIVLACAAPLVAGCGDDCKEGTEEVAAKSVCTAVPLAENQPLQIDVETAAIEGCEQPVCDVAVQGSDLFVTLERAACGPKSGEGCPASAESRVVACELPPLVFGSYAVRVNGAPSGVLSVQQGAAATTCTF